MAAEREEKKAGKTPFFQRLAENEKYRKIILAVGLFGILLILISGNMKSCAITEQKQPPISQPPTSTAENYEKRLETDLTAVISQISGAGNVKILVTLEQTAQNVYATEEKQSGQQTDETQSGTGKNETVSSDEKSYLLVKQADGSEDALQVTEIQPVVKGVVVVCDGGSDPKVQQSITDAVTTALHISSVRVCVIQAK